ncbi:DUF4385 domain-containing protein, partial [Salmonella enterica subsp. enterica serovar Enteritidis]|nr:DUF4385 domain-containing protein [Salmonella enterica subsp. enterica serovar Enteritidis]
MRPNSQPPIGRIKKPAATVFKGWWDKIRQDEDYLKRKRQHQARWG